MPVVSKQWFEFCWEIKFAYPLLIDPETLQGARANFWADFSANFASQSACLVPVEHLEQTREVASTNCNAWAITTAGMCPFPWWISWRICGGFLVDFSAHFPADFAAD